MTKKIEKLEIEKIKPYLKNAKKAGEYMLEHEATWERIECAPDGPLLSREKIADMIWQKIQNIL